ncbi:MAG: transposase [Chroococcales cyanobacterium]
MTNFADDYDSPWKEAITDYFQDFIRFFFPTIETNIDWNRGYEFLDTELQQITRDAEIGKREADKLVKVWRLNGQETWVLIHIEVQSQVKSNFPQRMYVYNNRIFDLYQREVASLAILADEQPSWRPTSFSYEIWGCRVLLEFPTVKLIDYKSQWETLQTQLNPFAVIVMAHLKTQETRQNSQTRYQEKLAIAKSLYQRGYNREQIQQLFRLIDWMMRLPDNLESGFRKALTEYEEERKMPFVAPFERLAKEEGREEGRKEGQLQKGRENILEILQIRFGNVPESLGEAINQIEDESILNNLLREAVTISSLTEFEQLLNE